MLRDDLTWVKGNHLFQFGGQVQKNFNYHTRTDNGSSINNQVVYTIVYNNINYGNGAGCSSAVSGTAGRSSCIPAVLNSARQGRLYQNLAASDFELDGQTQVIYTR